MIINKTSLKVSLNYYMANFKQFGLFRMTKERILKKEYFENVSEGLVTHKT